MFYTVAMGESFGVWLREHRKKVKMTQLDVAKRCGLSYSYISTLERNQPHSLTGKPILPTRDKVVLIAKAVNGDVDEALALCGYASSVPQTRPQTIPELIEALERLGIEAPQLYGGFPADPDGEGFREIVERIWLDVNLVVSRLQKGRRVNYTPIPISITEEIDSIPSADTLPFKQAK